MQTKHDRSQRTKCEEDRISLLPDCLLIEIISRLPLTNKAIATGILSKRWKNLWTEVHNLIFIRYYLGRRPELDIEKVLRQRGQSNLNKFQLDIPLKNIMHKQVNNWIRYAVSCNVQEIHLAFQKNVYVPCQNLFVLDKFFFINSSFTHMKLNGCVINPIGAVSWTNLKSLCIKWAVLDESLIRNNILSGSPLLETLKLRDCQGFGELDITSKSVKNLVFTGYRDYWDVAVVKINAPHILSLTIEEKLSSCIRKVVLLNVSSLVEATLDHYHGDYFDGPNKEDQGELLKGLILSLHHVKKLKIGDNCLETLARLKAKGFTFPSNMEHPDLPDYDSSGSEDCSDNDSTESED